MDLEEARWFASDGTPDPLPKHFDSRYTLPPHRTKHLQRLHAHERDDRIVFFEKEHIYTIDDGPAEVSVSSLLPERPFNPVDAIRMMRFGRREAFPRLAYVIDAQLVSSVSSPMDAKRGHLLYCNETARTVAVALPGSLPDVSTHDEMRIGLEKLASAKARMQIDLEHVMYSFERGMSDKEIEQQWADHAEDARNRGTEAHLQMELWLNSEPCRVTDPEVVIGLDFIRQCVLPLRAKPYRTEWEIFAEEENVAGSIDLALQLPDGRLLLVDWKRSEKLPKKMRGYEKLPEPLNYLPDCAGCRYAVQLSLYQYIIEKYYGLVVAGRALASLHPDVPFFTSTPYMHAEVSYLMNRQKERVNAQLRVAAKHPELCCTRTGRLATDAVRSTESNALLLRKCALVHEIDFVPDEYVRNMCNDLVAQDMRQIDIEGDKTVWNEVMPEKGVQSLLCDPTK